ELVERDLATEVCTKVILDGLEPGGESSTAVSDLFRLARRTDCHRCKIEEMCDGQLGKFRGIARVRRRQIAAEQLERLRVFANSARTRLSGMLQQRKERPVRNFERRDATRANSRQRAAIGAAERVC